MLMSLARLIPPSWRSSTYCILELVRCISSGATKLSALHWLS
jgi:hypothetical protein